MWLSSNLPCSVDSQTPTGEEIYHLQLKQDRSLPWGCESKVPTCTFSTALRIQAFERERYLLTGGRMNGKASESGGLVAPTARLMPTRGSCAISIEASELQI